MGKCLILTHVAADFDAAASCYAASLLYENSIPVLPGSPNKNVREFLALHSDHLRFSGEKEVKVDEIERIVLTDIQSLERTGTFFSLFKNKDIPITVYDHHPSQGISSFEEAYVEKVGSTTTILVEKLKKAQKVLSPAEATFLALGIHEDTGSLTFKNTTERDAKALAWLYSLGAQPDLIYRFLHSRFTELQSELLIKLIKNSRLELIHDRYILFSHAAVPDYIDGASAVVHRLVDTYNPDFTLVVLSMPGKLTLIARSSVQEADSLKILQKFDPSGHPEAAIAYVENKSAEEVFKEVREELKKHLKPEIKVKDVMTKVVITVTPQTKITEILELFKKTGHSGFPVVEKDKLVGIITRTEAEKAVYHNLAHAPVKGFMIRDVSTIGPDESLNEAVQKMLESGVGRLPVIKNDKIVGIITRTDVLRVLHGKSYYLKEDLELKQLVLQRFKEKIPFEVQQLLHLTGFIAEELGYTAYLVGGLVRDLILGYENLDYDIVVEGSAIEVAKRLARSTGARVDAYRRFDTAVVIFKTGLRFDLATARTEFYEKPGALPKVQRSGIRSDLLRRDFSINALAMSLSRKNFGEIVDVAGGLKDLRNKTIRVLHSLSFIEDPTRVIRAIRFEAKFNFKMDETTESLAREAVRLSMLKKAPSVRLRDELFDLFKEDSFMIAIFRAEELGVFKSLFPGFKLTPKKRKMLKQISEHKFEETTREIKKISVFAALLSDYPQEFCSEMATELKLNANDKKIFLETLQLIMEKDTKLTSNSEIYEFLSRFKEKSLISASYLLSKSSPLKNAISRYLRQIKDIKPPLSGSELLSLGFQESPALGQVKQEIFKLYLDGKIKSKDEAIMYAKKRLEEIRAGKT